MTESRDRLKRKFTNLHPEPGMLATGVSPSQVYIPGCSRYFSASLNYPLEETPLNEGYQYIVLHYKPETMHVTLCIPRALEL